MSDSRYVAPYYMSVIDSDWHYIPFTRDDTNLTLDFKINHFTIFAVIADNKKPSVNFTSPKNNLYLLSFSSFSILFKCI